MGICPLKCKDSRYRHLTSHGKARGEAITAVARELAGFVWAEMTA